MAWRTSQTAGISTNASGRGEDCTGARIRVTQLRNQTEKAMPATATVRLIAISACATLLGTPAVGSGIASADPIPASQCGAHTEALDCMTDPSPPTQAEQSFLNSVGPHFPNVPSAWLLQYARGTCVMLHRGVSAGVVAGLLADRISASKQIAGQVMDGAMQADCPNLTVGTDGVAR